MQIVMVLIAHVALARQSPTEYTQFITSLKDPALPAGWPGLAT